MLTNIFIFVFGPEVVPEYIRFRIRVKKNIPNMFVFIFGPQKNIRYALIISIYNNITISYITRSQLMMTKKQDQNIIN